MKGRRSRGSVALVALCAAFLYAIYQGGSLAWHLLGFLIVLALVSIISQAGPLNELAIERRIQRGPYQAGDGLEVSLWLTSKRRWMWPNLLVMDHLPQEFGVADPRFVISRIQRDPIRFSYHIPALKRGIYELNHVSLVATDLFGLLERQHIVHQDTRFTVWPASIPLGDTDLFSRLWHGEHLSSQPTREESTHLRGIREYVPGDRLSHVHWKTSAHTGDFKVKQFEPETKPEFTVIVDYGRHFTSLEWELALSATASLLRYAFTAHQAIALIALDTPDNLFPAGTGSPRLEAMLNFLSSLTYDPHRRSASLPRWSGARTVVITATRHQDPWRTQADVLIGIGPNGLETLEDLPQLLNPRLSHAEGGDV